MHLPMPVGKNRGAVISGRGPFRKRLEGPWTRGPRGQNAALPQVELRRGSRGEWGWRSPGKNPRGKAA